MKLELTEQEVALILAALAKFPLGEVYEIYTKIKAQKENANA